MIPVSGPVTLGMIATELGIALPLSLGDPRARALAGKPSGPISLGDLRGKSAYTPPTISCDTYVEGHGPGAPGEWVFAQASPFFQILDGEAPFKVVWTRVSGPPLTVSGSNPPTFSGYDKANWTLFATYKGTVTDNRGAVVVSPNIQISLRGGDAI